MFLQHALGLRPLDLYFFAFMALVARIVNISSYVVQRFMLKALLGSILKAIHLPVLTRTREDLVGMMEWR